MPKHPSVAILISWSDVECLTTYTLFRQNASDLNSELYSGFFTPKHPNAGINEYTGGA